MDFLVFAEKYKSLFPNATPEQAIQAFQMSGKQCYIV